MKYQEMQRFEDMLDHSKFETFDLFQNILNRKRKTNIILQMIE
jgi:hypothetical protein